MEIHMSDEKYPKLNFPNKIREYPCDEDYKVFYFSRKDFYEDNLNKNKIVKRQSISDLKKINRMFDNLRVNGKDYTIYGQGHECYLSEENNKLSIITMNDHIYSRKFDTKLGTIICENHGEFGGVIYKNTNDSLEVMGFGSFEYIFEYDDKVYAITTLCHMGGYDCSLHRIVEFEDKYLDLTIFNSWDLNFGGYYAEENYLYFYSNSEYNGLYRFNLDTFELDLISKDLCRKIEVNSLLKKDDYIYIYGNYNVVEYDLKINEITSIYTNLEYEEIDELLYVGDEKLIDVWDNILI